MDDSDIPPGMEPVVVTLLRRGPKADSFSDEELEELQEAHVAYRRTLSERGLALVNGPFVDQPDETLRGLSVFSCSLEEAQVLNADDPSVKAGRLATEVFTWLVPEGTFRPPAR